LVPRLLHLFERLFLNYKILLALVPLLDLEAGLVLQHIDTWVLEGRGALPQEVRLDILELGKRVNPHGKKVLLPLQRNLLLPIVKALDTKLLKPG